MLRPHHIFRARDGRRPRSQVQESFGCRGSPGTTETTETTCCRWLSRGKNTNLCIVTIEASIQMVDDCDERRAPLFLCIQSKPVMWITHGPREGLVDGGACDLPSLRRASVQGAFRDDVPLEYSNICKIHLFFLLQS